MVARAGLDRQVIVMTAAEVADLNGLDNVTLKAVAERLGVRNPSLYNHIDGLSELKRELSIWGTNQLRAVISEAAIGKAGEDAVFAIAIAYRAFAQQRPGLYQAIISTPDRNCQTLKISIRGMMDVIKIVLAPFCSNETEKTHAARGLRSLLHGFVALEAAGWFALPIERDESYKQLITAFIRGIQPLP